MGKKSEMRGLSRGRQPRHLSSGCHCSRLGSVWVSPQFAKAQLPKHKRQQRAKHGESFPVLILGLHIEGESGDLSGLLGLYETVPNLSCQTLCPGNL